MIAALIAATLANVQLPEDADTFSVAVSPIDTAYCWKAPFSGSSAPEYVGWSCEVYSPDSVDVYALEVDGAQWLDSMAKAEWLSGDSDPSADWMQAYKGDPFRPFGDVDRIRQ